MRDETTNPPPVLTERGLICLLRQLEMKALDAADSNRRMADTKRDLGNLIHDNRRLEQERDKEVRSYHAALEACRALLKKRGVKAKDMPALPPTWERTAKQIADDEDIPF